MSDVHLRPLLSLVTRHDSDPPDQGGDPACWAQLLDGPGTTLHTVGHGTLAADELVALLRAAGIEHVVDIRSYPGSRHNPHYAREEMERWLPASDVSYTWFPDLGGRRRPVDGSRHLALRHDAFRAYADHMETATFRSGASELLRLASAGPATVLCSESVWWRCHRRLLADHMQLMEAVEVQHLMHDGRRTLHPPTEGVRVSEGGLVYDVGVTAPLDLS